MIICLFAWLHHHRVINTSLELSSFSCFQVPSLLRWGFGKMGRTWLIHSNLLPFKQGQRSHIMSFLFRWLQPLIWTSGAYSFFLSAYWQMVSFPISLSMHLRFQWLLLSSSQLWQNTSIYLHTLSVLVPCRGVMYWRHYRSKFYYSRIPYCTMMESNLSFLEAEELYHISSLLRSHHTQVDLRIVPRSSQEISSSR